MARDPALDEEESAVARLIQEAERYQTVKTVAGWPLVSNTTQRLLDSYTAFKKENEVGRLVLVASEGLTEAACQLVLLPLVHTPLVRTPLKMADCVADAGAHLLERAMPQLKDKEKPLRLDGDLVISLLLLPLTLSLALSHLALEGVAATLVAVFPELKEAAKGFDQKGILGQCATLWLMTSLYLPVQLLSHPTQTVRQALSVPSQVVSTALGWAGTIVASLQHEATEWVLWATLLPRNLFLGAVALVGKCASSVAALVRHYVTAGLDFVRRVAAGGCTSVGAYVTSGRESVQGYVASGRKSVQGYTDRLPSVRPYVISGLALVGALLQAAYNVLFVATGLEAWLQWLWAALGGRLQEKRDSVQQLLHSAANTAPVKGLVRRMRTSSPTRSCSQSGTSESSTVAGNDPSEAPAAAVRGWLGHLLTRRGPVGGDLWAPEHIALSLLLTLGPVVFVVAAASLY